MLHRIQEIRIHYRLCTEMLKVNFKLYMHIKVELEFIKMYGAFKKL